MSDILKNWTTVEIGELCDLVNGRAFKTSEWSEKGLPIIRIQNLNGSKSNYNYFDGELDEKHLIQKGDLLFAWSGTPRTSFGSHVWKGSEAALNQHIFKINFPRELVDVDFLQYAINQTLDGLIGEARGGVGLRHITKKVFEKTELILPSLEEQKEIASSLNRLLKQVDIIKSRIDVISNIVKQFRESVLSDAVSGKLLETCQYGSNISNWKNVSLKDVALKFSYGTSSKSSKEGKIPVLRMGNIQNGKIEWNNLVFTSNQKEIDKYKLRKGDILFNRTNSPELVGKTAIYRGEQEAIYAGYLIKIVCGDSLLPDFLNIHLNSPRGKQYCKRVKSDGVSQSNINAKKIAAYSFLLPSIKEQAEIIAQVGKFLSFADNIEKQVTTVQARVEKITPFILEKAFQGELTDKWRAKNSFLITGENSAKKLLEQIKVKHREQSKINKNKRNSTKRKTNTRKKEMIIPIIKALKNIDKAISTNELLVQSGYPQDASIEQIEDFFLDIRQQLEDDKISCERKDNEDYFMLINQVNK